MRPFRSLILLLVLAIAVFVALIRPLPGHATEVTVKKLTRKISRTTSHRRQLVHHHSAEYRQRLFGHKVVQYARKFSGVPYVWGGSTPHPGFDCSGFVRYVYQHFGISLPHSSYSQLGHGRRVARKYLRPGDILFFAGGSHVGIYLSGNRVIDAPHSGAVVHVSTMNSWYSSEYYTARRFAHGH